MSDRVEILEEHLLRKVIRNIIRKKINEAEANASSPDAPYDITAMNFLRTLLQNIIPKIESSYKSLTTSKDQRDSFRAHILNGVDDLLSTVDTDPEVPAAPGREELEEEIEIAVGEDEGPPDLQDEEGFIDITDDEPEAEEESEEEAFGKTISDKQLDNTGRNAAYSAFKEVSTQIENTYQKIDPDSMVDADKVPEIGRDVSERKVFKTYLLKNLDLYFKRFEEELQTNPDVPDIEV